jgi:hypothetical protein
VGHWAAAGRKAALDIAVVITKLTITLADFIAQNRVAVEWIFKYGTMALFGFAATTKFMSAANSLAGIFGFYGPGRRRSGKKLGKMGVMQQTVAVC